MAFVRDAAVLKGCIICGSAVERANVSSICNACKDAMTGRKPPARKKK